MTGAWMAYALAIAAAAGLAGLAAERALRVMGWPQRWAWALSIAASLFLPFFLTFRSARVPHPPVAGSTARVDGPALVEFGAVPAGVAPVAFDWRGLLERALVSAWIAASILGVLLLLASAFTLLRRRRGWRGATVAGTKVLVSRDAGPAVVGCFGRTIVVPEWVLEWSAQRQRLILMHEREHLFARDPLLVLMGWVALVVAPWNLPLWWQVRRLRLSVEMDCDRRVLDQYPDVRGYGLLLLEVGRRTSGSWLPATAFSEPESFLERRIRCMTARAPRYRRVQAAALLLLIGLVPAVLSAAPVVDHPGIARVGGWVGAARGMLASPDEVATRIVMRRLPSGGDSLTMAPSVPIEILGDERARDTVPDGAGGFAYELAELERAPQLSNAGTMASVMERLYPAELQARGLGGTVLLRFVVEPDGTVDEETVQAIDSPHDALLPATLEAATRLRFRPGQYRGQNVRVMMEMPIAWAPRLLEEEEAPRRRDEQARLLIERAKILVAVHHPSLLATTLGATELLIVVEGPDGRIRGTRRARADEEFTLSDLAPTPDDVGAVTVIKDHPDLEFAPALMGTGIVWINLRR